MVVGWCWDVHVCPPEIKSDLLGAMIRDKCYPLNITFRVSA